MKVVDVISYLNQYVPFKYFANEFPESAKDNCGVVRVEGGDAPDIYSVGIKSPSIQVLIRHKNVEQAESIAKQVWELFHANEHYSIASTYVFLSRCDQSEPVYVGLDKNNRAVYSVNISCKVRE